MSHGRLLHDNVSFNNVSLRRIKAVSINWKLFDKPILSYGGDSSHIRWLFTSTWSYEHSRYSCQVGTAVFSCLSYHTKESEMAYRWILCFIFFFNSPSGFIFPLSASILLNLHVIVHLLKYINTRIDQLFDSKHDVFSAWRPWLSVWIFFEQVAIIFSLLMFLNGNPSNFLLWS